VRLSLLLLVLGAWLAIAGTTVAAVTTSFRVAPDAQHAAAAPEAAGARAHAMRFNVALLRWSSRVQLVLGGLAVLLASRPPLPSRGALAALALAALLAAGLGVVVLPRAAAVAQQLADETEHGHVADDPSRAARFARLHGAFGVLGLAESLLVAGAAIALVAAARRTEARA
jgi:hypothetical protein